MTGLYIAFHRWRGLSLGISEPDLFSHVWVMGFLTVHVCKACLLETIRKIRAASWAVVNASEKER